MKFDIAVSFQGRGEGSALEALTFDFVLTPSPSPPCGFFSFACTPAGVLCRVLWVFGSDGYERQHCQNSLHGRHRDALYQTHIIRIQKLTVSCSCYKSCDAF